MAKIKVEYKNIKDLIPYAMNARTHSDAQVEQIATSIREFGFNNPVLIDPNGGLIAGHGRVMAAQFLKLKEVPCITLGHLSEAQKQAYILADNKIALNSGWDFEKLAQEMSAIADSGIDLAFTGFDDQEIEAILRDDSIIPDDNENSGPVTLGNPELDHARSDIRQELIVKYQIKPGQIWQLGDHKVICGDSTDPETYKKLMGKEIAQMTFTDPPYGVSYKDKEDREIENDSLTRDALSQFLTKSFELMRKYTKHTGAFYIWHASSTRKDFEHAMTRAGIVEKQYLVWIKDSFVLGRSHYHWQTEPCFYAEKDGQTAEFFGGRDVSNVWRLAQLSGLDGAIQVSSGLLVTDGTGGQLYITAKPAKNKKTRHIRVLPGESIALSNGEKSDCWQVSRDSSTDYLHPTQKPVDLSIKAIENSSKPGDIVLEPFGGSGSTLMGCELTGRKCRLIEIDPEFIAVIIERWALQSLNIPVCLNP